MTNEDAHGYLEDMQGILTQYRFIFSREMADANGLAILALEKQIPKEASCIKRYPYPVYVCPICGAGVDKDTVYCRCCGQLIEERGIE